jgi:putative RecB family exonuclease
VQPLSQSELTPPPHLSASSIGTFNQCPLKFRYNKIDQIPDVSGEAAVMGNFVHDVLEELYKLPAEERTVDNARALAKNVWDEIWVERATSSVKTEEEVRLFRWRSWFCIENLWSLEDPQELEPDGLEFEVVGNIEGVVIKGFIDRYSTLSDGESLIVSDYKTGKTPRPQYQADKFFQLYIYAYMLEKMGVGTAKELELLYLKDGVRLKKHVTAREARNMVAHVIETKKQVDECCKTGEFEARKSILCNWCSYQEICPLFGGTK